MLKVDLCRFEYFLETKFSMEECNVSQKKLKIWRSSRREETRLGIEVWMPQLQGEILIMTWVGVSTFSRSFLPSTD